MALEFLKKLEFKKPKELIGVDIGTTSIKISLLKNSKDGFAIECMRSENIRRKPLERWLHYRY